MNSLINTFRVASRELFNNYFCIADPYENNGWQLEEDFSSVEAQLFRAMVVNRSELADIEYGLPNEQLVVRPSSEHGIPLMLNREIHSGYWDHPVEKAPSEAAFTFVAFFDWDSLAIRDNRYVKVIVKKWPSNPELIGKYALIESQYVNYEHAV